MLRDLATSRPRDNLPPCYGVFLYLIGRLSDVRRAPDAFHRWVNLGSSSHFICHSGILSPAEKLPVSTAVPCFRFLSSLGSREACESGRRRTSRFSPSDINEGFLDKLLARISLSPFRDTLAERRLPTITRQIHESGFKRSQSRPTLDRSFQKRIRNLG